MTTTWQGPSAERTARILSGEVPVLPQEERRRRRSALATAAVAEGCDFVLVYGAGRNGSGVGWLTGWGTTREAALLVDLREVDGDVLWVQFHNHVRLAGERAHGCEVRWGGADTMRTVGTELGRRGAGGRRLGVIGPLGWTAAQRLAADVGQLVDLSGAYTRLRMRKSDHELDLLAVGAHLSDAAARALADAVRPGATDRDLADAVERAYVPLGGQTHIHYIGVTDMASPDRPVPPQLPLGRVVHDGSVVIAELSARFAGYAGQVLRTMTPAAELTPRYRELHDVATAAFHAVCDALVPGATPADLVDAAGVIEDAGFTTIDDLVHGFGGGYLPPVIGSASRPAGPLPDLRLEVGNCVVVQPNVVDGDAGVQTGELVVVTEDGAVSLHSAAPGPWTSVGAAG